MKKTTFRIAVLLLFAFNCNAQQTIYDVLNDNAYRTYGNKITAIEADSFKVLNNSPEDQVKRYYRMRYFLDNRIDSASTMNTYMQACLNNICV